MMDEKPWPPDPLLDEVEEVRMRILEEHGGDYHKVFEFYMENQKRHGDRLITLEADERSKDKSAA
jgi:hypothetical protein